MRKLKRKFALWMCATFGHRDRRVGELATGVDLCECERCFRLSSPPSTYAAELRRMFPGMFAVARR